MRILIKLFLRDIEEEKILSILDDYDGKIFDKNKVLIKIITNIKINNKNIIFIERKNIPEIINYELNKYDWDIIIPLTDLFIPVKNFDKIIKEKYSEIYPKKDGVLILKDDIFIIGKNYYKELGYIYNTSYEKNNFEKEFKDVLKLKNKYKLLDDDLFEKINIIPNDDIIYNFRKSLNFCLDVTEKNKNNTDKDDILIEENNDVLNIIEIKQEESKRSVLNKFVDQVYLINLERRRDKLNHMIKEFNKFNINYNRFNAIDGLKLNTVNDTPIRKSQIACLRSHSEVLKLSIENNYEKIAVFEDDIILCDDFEERFNYYINNIPDDWEIMLLGCNLENCKYPIQIKPYIHRVYNAYGCFSMILNNKNGLFRRILNKIFDEKKPIDHYFHDSILGESKSYVFLPFFTKTLFTISDISSNKNSFSYTIVDKLFKNKINIDNNLSKKMENTQVIREENYYKSTKDICEEYLKSRYPFQIFFNGRVIFDSSTSDKINVAFFDTYFTVYSRPFIYQGMSIRNK